MARETKNESIDSAIVLLIIKKLTKPIVQTQAYKLGLVNGNGMVIKVPDTASERSSLTLLDRFAFKLKRLLGTRLVSLNDFLYVHSTPSVYNQLRPTGNLQQRAEIKRIARDVSRLAEQYDCDLEHIINSLINEELREVEID